MDIKKAKSLIVELLQKGGFAIEDIIIEEKGEQEYSINIHSPADAVSFIGHRGEVLVALQYLIKNILRNQALTNEGDHIKLDVDSYRQNQESNVLQMADKRAQDVIESGRAQILPPMSAFFRRLVHLHIKANYPELHTMSQGSGNYRSVSISLGEGASEQPHQADVYAELGF